MGLYKNSKDASNTLVPIAGRGKAEYGASTVRTGSFEIQMNITDSTYDLAVTFSTPMPDNDYLVDLTCHNQHGSVCILNGTKTANGFTARASCVDSTAVGETMLVSYTAFKLYTDIEYNAILKAPFIGKTAIKTFQTRQQEIWTATENCWVCGFVAYVPEMGDYNPNVYVDDVLVGIAYSDGIKSYSPICFPVKAGQEVKTRFGNEGYTPSSDIVNMRAYK